MKSYTAHLKPGRQPVLVKEGFAWGALLFGPVWLAAQRAWIAAALYVGVLVVLGAVVHGPAHLVMVGGVAWLAGLTGRDLVRWSLERRGYVLTTVLAARDEDAALGRLFTYRPDVVAGLAALIE